MERQNAGPAQVTQMIWTSCMHYLEATDAVWWYSKFMRGLTQALDAGCYHHQLMELDVTLADWKVQLQGTSSLNSLGVQEVA